MRRVPATVLVVLTCIVLASPALALSPAAKCQVAKLKRTGLLSACLFKADATGIRRGSAADYSKCTATFNAKWAKAELDAAGQCPSNGDAAPMLLRIQSSRSFAALTLVGPRYVDNLDGTVTDTQTGLMWEVKGNLDGVANLSNPHDADNTYDWHEAMSGLVSQINQLGGYTDWRMPRLAELEALLVPGCTVGPCIAPAFGATANDLSYWTASTTFYDPNTGDAIGWLVNFIEGSVYDLYGTTLLHARLVRKVP